MNTHTIRRGFDIKIAGAASPEVESCPEPPVAGLRPDDFLGLRPKVLVKPGQRVRTGEPLLRDKGRPGVVYCSPATGEVARIELGARRFPLRIEVTVGDDDFAPVPRIDPDKIASAPRDELIAALQGAGLWPLLRQRPVGKIADPAALPAAIYVNGLDTEPLACDPAIAVRGRGEALQLGIDLLARLTEGKVFVTRRAGALAPELAGLRNAEVHDFAGPHPAGLVGTHIAMIAPLGAGRVAWYLKAQEAVAIGEWLATGHYPTHRVVAVAGSAAPRRSYCRVRNGALLSAVMGGAPPADARVIDGTVLSGVKSAADGLLGFYTHTVTVIPSGADTRDLFGWATPQFGRHSASRSVFGWVAPKDQYELDARMNGGPRNIVNIGAWEDMTPLDIHPTFLVRAIQAGDLEEALGLGLLEVTEEDVALCTYADPCKIEVGDIVRKGLDLFEKEG